MLHHLTYCSRTILNKLRCGKKQWKRDETRNDSACNERKGQKQEARDNSLLQDLIRADESIADDERTYAYIAPLAHTLDPHDTLVLCRRMISLRVGYCVQNFLNFLNEEFDAIPHRALDILIDILCHKFSKIERPQAKTRYYDTLEAMACLARLVLSIPRHLYLPENLATARNFIATKTFRDVLLDPKSICPEYTFKRYAWHRDLFLAVACVEKVYFPPPSELNVLDPVLVSGEYSLLRIIIRDSSHLEYLVGIVKSATEYTKHCVKLSAFIRLAQIVFDYMGKLSDEDLRNLRTRSHFKDCVDRFIQSTCAVIGGNHPAGHDDGVTSEMMDRLIPSVHHANRPLPLNGYNDLVICLETLKEVGWLPATYVSLLKIPIYSVFREWELTLHEHAASNSIADIYRATKGLGGQRSSILI